MKQKVRQNIVLWLIIFMFSLVMCFSFLQPHYAHDTYEVMYKRIKRIWGKCIFKWRKTFFSIFCNFSGHVAYTNRHFNCYIFYIRNRIIDYSNINFI